MTMMSASLSKGRIGEVVCERISEIERAIQPWPSWLDDLNRRRVAILCIGENHEPYLRRILADSPFATLNADALLLETTPREVKCPRSRTGWKRQERLASGSGRLR